MQFPLKAVIVENEIDVLEDLVNMLNEYPNIIKIEKTFTRYKEAVTYFLNNSRPKPFDVSILDVYLDDTKNCYHLIDAIGIDRLGILVITTARPVIPEGMDFTLSDFMLFPKIHTDERVANFIKKLKKEAEDIIASGASPKKFSISIKDKPEQLIDFEDIVCITSTGKESKQTSFVCNNGKEFESNEQFSSVLLRVKHRNFFQCYRGGIVNINYINLMDANKSGSLHLLYANGTFSKEIYYSDDYSIELMREINSRP
jgi:DNA-binding LytR/AlgR family response regulator